MNTKNTRTVVSLASLVAAAVPALAQTNVDPANKFSWSENCGWLNWADAGDPAGQQGVVVHASFLSGFIWGENIGWINVGNGSPTDDCDGSACYSTINGSESGVNLDPITGELTGLAWGENVGWINFSGGALATPPNPARIDLGAGRLRGYAWGENIGWINLDHVTHFVGIIPESACDPDVNCDGAVNGFDVEATEQAINGDFSNFCQSSADLNNDGAENGFDIETEEQRVNGAPC